MKKYYKKIKLFGKEYQVKEKSIAYYAIEYVIPSMLLIGTLAILWGIYILLYYAMLPYSTMF